MSTLVIEKRKNDELHKRRAIPWWLILLVGFGMGIIFTLSMSIGRSGNNMTMYSNQSLPADFAAHATLQAQDAQNKLALGEIDALLATATSMVSEATFQAAGPGGFEGLNATETAIIVQATQQAANPSSSS